MIIDLLLFVAIGLAAGWLAGVLLRGRGFGWRTNLVVGLAGALVGGLGFPILGVSATSLLGKVLLATLGAVGVLLTVAFLLKPRSTTR